MCVCVCVCVCVCLCVCVCVAMMISGRERGGVCRAREKSQLRPPSTALHPHRQPDLSRRLLRPPLDDTPRAGINRTRQKEKGGEKQRKRKSLHPPSPQLTRRALAASPSSPPLRATSPLTLFQSQTPRALSQPLRPSQRLPSARESAASLLFLIHHFLAGNVLAPPASVCPSERPLPLSPLPFPPFSPSLPLLPSAPAHPLRCTGRWSGHGAHVQEGAVAVRPTRESQRQRKRPLQLRPPFSPRLCCARERNLARAALGLALPPSDSAGGRRGQKTERTSGRRLRRKARHFLATRTRPALCLLPGALYALLHMGQRPAAARASAPPLRSLLQLRGGASAPGCG